jgi:peptidoglycan/xylan/chitin deacetylase (PgdA/CDA1 family)
MLMHHKLLMFFYPIFILIRKFSVMFRIISPNRLRVLAYHDIPEAEEASFEAQLRWLTKYWNIISPAEFEAIMSGKSPLIGDNLLITFDDGLIGNRVIAEKILNPLGIKAIFFVISDFVKIETSLVSRQFIAKHIIPNSRLSDIPKTWKNMQLSDLSALIKQGHTIGHHTKLHSRLSDCLTDDELEDELVSGSKYISTQLGIDINHFAYTFGDIESFSEAALNVARCHFQFIYSGLRGNNSQEVSPLSIRRDAAAYQLSNNEYRVFSNKLLGAFLEGAADFHYKISIKILDSWCEKN